MTHMQTLPREDLFMIPNYSSPCILIKYTSLRVFELKSPPHGPCCQYCINSLKQLVLRDSWRLGILFCIHEYLPAGLGQDFMTTQMSQVFPMVRIIYHGLRVCRTREAETAGDCFNICTTGRQVSAWKYQISLLILQIMMQTNFNSFAAAVLQRETWTGAIWQTSFVAIVNRALWEIMKQSLNLTFHGSWTAPHF